MYHVRKPQPGMADKPRDPTKAYKGPTRVLHISTGPVHDCHSLFFLSPVRCVCHGPGQWSSTCRCTLVGSSPLAMQNGLMAQADEPVRIRYRFHRCSPSAPRCASWRAWSSNFICRLASSTDRSGLVDLGAHTSVTYLSCTHPRSPRTRLRTFSSHLLCLFSPLASSGLLFAYSNSPQSCP